MKIIRTFLWLLILSAVLIFSWGNWDQDTIVRIWEGIVWETKLPAVVIVAFLLGLLPIWLYARGARWRYHRKIAALEAQLRQRDEIDAQERERQAALAAEPRATPADAEPTPIPHSETEPEMQAKGSGI